MKQHTIRINVSLDLEKSSKSNISKQSTLKNASCYTSAHEVETISKSGLNNSKVIHCAPQKGFDTVACNTLSTVKGSLVSSNDLKKTNTTE